MRSAAILSIQDRRDREIRPYTFSLLQDGVTGLRRCALFFPQPYDPVDGPDGQKPFH